MDEETLQNVLLAIRLGVVTIAIWVASRYFDLWQSGRRRAADRDAYIRAIYAEIDFNTFDMSRFLDATISLERLAVIFEEKEGFIPHITDARHTEVYRSRIGELHAVASDGAGLSDLVGELVRFYGELEKVTQQIEGLMKPSFAHISTKGKVATIGTIYRSCEVCERIGTALLREMELRYAHLRLSRNNKGAHMLGAAGAGTSEDLENRLKKLSSDLDRVNKSGH